MEDRAGLTARQEQFLAVVLEEKFILDRFYLTGGTALSSWYLHHRQSYDLDFFSLERFHKEHIIRWMTDNKGRIGYDSVRLEEDWGGGESLQVDYPCTQHRFCCL